MGDGRWEIGAEDGDGEGRSLWEKGAGECKSLEVGGLFTVSAVVSDLSTGTRKMMSMTFSYIYPTATTRLWIKGWSVASERGASIETIPSLQLLAIVTRATGRIIRMYRMTSILLWPGMHHTRTPPLTPQWEPSHPILLYCESRRFPSDYDYIR